MQTGYDDAKAELARMKNLLPEFVERLEHVVKAVYESVRMLGFKEWIYDGGKSI